ncbi:hypothetical protein [Pandoraea communis]|uniref:hypothetical protein n=1 Tax=Pandoraea communis TaxID=2508297 RepID=UPI0025A61803|nr:hypothetical protein [Pandoraea communis]MDM8356618.1 hypothetical protein [Pandoraea communis]
MQIMAHILRNSGSSETSKGEESPITIEEVIIGLAQIGRDPSLPCAYRALSQLRPHDAHQIDRRDKVLREQLRSLPLDVK